MAKVRIEVTLPDIQLKWFLDLLRQWDAGHEDNAFRIWVDSPTMSAQEADRIIRSVEPWMPIIVKIDTPEQEVGPASEAASPTPDA